MSAEILTTNPFQGIYPRCRALRMLYERLGLKSSIELLLNF